MGILEKIHNDIAKGDTKAVMEALKVQPSLLRAQGAFGDTLLHRAAFHGNAELVRFLVKQGLEISLADQTGFTPLHEAARGKSVETINALIELGASMTARTGNSKKTPLGIAEANGSAGVVRALQAADPALRQQEIERKRRVEALAQEENERRIRAAHHEAEIRKPVWNLTAQFEIASTTMKPEINCRLTEIFNFSNKTYILRTENLSTKAEAVFMKTFSEFGDGDLIDLAREKYKSMAGKDLPDEGDLDKPAPAVLRKPG